MKIKNFNNNLTYKIIKKTENFICLKIKNNLSSLSGLSLTVGNTIRRILLNNILGTSITYFNIKQPKNYKFIIDGLKEDFFEFKSNFKKIILKSNKIAYSKAKLNIKGPAIVTASDINFNNNITLINPTQYLFTITSNITINIDFFIEQGFGYKFYNEKKNIILDNENLEFIDTNFSPVLKVNYKTTIENSTSEDFKLNEVLFLEIWTNGSITPLRSFLEACKIASTLFSSLLN